MSYKVDARADGGDFRQESLKWDILALVGAHQQGIPDTVDLSECVHLKSYSLACLASLGIRSCQLGAPTRLILPSNQECREHVVRMGLCEWFEPSGVVPVTASSTNVPIRNLTNHPGSSFASQVVANWANEMDQMPTGLQPAIEGHIDEMVCNAMQHSESPVGCLVVGQTYRSAGYVEAVILDLGITIRAHLSRNPQHCDLASDEEAIRTAVQENVSGTPAGQFNRMGQPNSGVGLTRLVRFCENGNGLLTVLSGNSYVCFGESEVSVHRLHRRFEGTLVNIRFFTGSTLQTSGIEEILL